MIAVLALLLMAQFPGEWGGMTREKNDTYDWTRPWPERMKQACKLGYRGTPPSPVGFMSFDRLKFDGARLVRGASLFTPLSAATVRCYEAFKGFKPEPADLTDLLGRIIVLIDSEVEEPDDKPHAALLMSDGKTIIPAATSSWSNHKIEICEQRSMTACWRGSLLATFQVSEKPTGLGYVLIRWQGGERRIPINFDYLR